MLARQTIAQSFKQFYGSLSVNIWSLALQCRPYHALGPHCSKLRNGFRSQNQLQLILYCRPKQQSLPARDASFANPQLASFFSTTTHCASSSTKSSGPVYASGYGKLSDTPPTDFAALDVLGDIQGPSAGVEVITSDGFKLSNGIRVLDAGVLLVGGEAFKWRPWLASGGGNRKEDTRSKSKTDLLKNSRGQWEIHESCWGLLDLVWPKPGDSYPFSTLF